MARIPTNPGAKVTAALPYPAPLPVGKLGLEYRSRWWVSWPSRTSGEYDLLNKPAGHVYFAGDWLTYYIAWQAGAFDSARKVVTDIHSRVLR
jgi:hypothetical protein